MKKDGGVDDDDDKVQMRMQMPCCGSRGEHERHVTEG